MLKTHHQYVASRRMVQAYYERRRAQITLLVADGLPNEQIVKMYEPSDCFYSQIQDELDEYEWHLDLADIGHFEGNIGGRPFAAFVNTRERKGRWSARVELVPVEGNPLGMKVQLLPAQTSEQGAREHAMECLAIMGFTVC